MPDDATETSEPKARKRAKVSEPVADATATPAQARPSLKERARAIWRRKKLVIAAGLVVVVGLNAWGVIAIAGWSSESDRLQVKAAELGDDVASTQALAAYQQNELALITSQAEAAEAFIAELTDDVAVEDSVRDSVRAATDLLRACVVARRDLTAQLWVNAAGAAQINAVDAQCDAAKSAYTTASRAAR